MLLNYLPEFHAIKSVQKALQTPDEPDCYICLIDATIDGVREDVRYVSRADDPFGIAPQVREALNQWIAEGKPVEGAE